MAKRATTARTADENWVRPAHSGFDAPTYGEVSPIGTIWKSADGKTYIDTKDGPKLLKR